jgi:hypothetical protein
MFDFRKCPALWLIAVIGVTGNAEGKSVEELKKAN